MSSQYNIIKYPPIFTKDGERVYRLGEPGCGDPRNITVQDYKTIKKEHLEKKTLFRDPQFPLYEIKNKNNVEITWMRPIKISNNPMFCSKEYTKSDVKQGVLGDCWFLSTVSEIATKKNVIRQVIPSGQSFAKNYAGIFRFRFWQYGKWIEVVVDDRLPTLDGDLYYVSSRSRNIFWSALLEKAYAKLYGGYNEIEGGCCDEALSDFTGGVCEYFSFEDIPDNFFSILLKGHERDSLLCTGTENCQEEPETKDEEVMEPKMEEEIDTKDDENTDTTNKDGTDEETETSKDDGTINKKEDETETSDEEENDNDEIVNKIYIEENSIATVCDNDYIPGDDFDSDDEAAMYANFEFDNEEDSDDSDEDDDETPGFQPAHSEAIFDDGLVEGHAYSLTSVRYVTSNEEGKEIKVPLVKIRNPWGKTEWSGRWSDNSLKWNTVSKEEKIEIDLLCKEDGEFWMHYDDFIKRFEEVYLCHWKYDHLAPKEETNNRSWEVRTIQGELTEENVKAPSDDEEERLALSPQYVIVLVDPDEDDDDDLCTLIVSLQTKHARITNTTNDMSFSIYKKGPEDPKPLSKEFFKCNKPVHEPNEHAVQRECTGRYRLPPGTYYLIPNATFLDNNGKFLLRVFTEKQCALKIHDDTIGTIEIDERVKDVMVKPPKFKFENLCWIELMEILNYAIVTHDERGFSKDACRSMITMQDKNHTGQINRIEFKALWDDICILKAIFRMYDAKNNGSIPMYNLQRALRSAGFIINEKVYNILAQRYAISHDGNLILEDFLICALRLKRIFATYKEKLDAENSTPFTLEEWIMNLIAY